MEGRVHARGATRPHNRPKYRAARAFYLTLLIGACLALYLCFNLPQNQAHSVHSVLHKRGDVGQLDEGEQCRLVHRADDQCAFIKRECPTDEGGFAAYLDLYYCKLPHAKAVAFVILILWLGLLFSTIGIAASDFFCINLSTIARILGMSESMAGVTFLAFGNGSPDVFSTFAAMKTNSGSLAVGELFGAAGFITAVVAGSMALIRPFHVARKSFIRDVGFFVVAAAFSLVFLWDGKLRFWECIAMVVYYFFYVAFVVVWHWWIGRRRRRREREAAMRGQFAPPGDELLIEEEEYHDDPDDRSSHASLSQNIAREDWSALERGRNDMSDGSNDEEEEAERDRWLSELNSNMRLTRPVRHRSQTLVPVRPSLVGALEFQAVLKSLQKSRNIQTYPLHARRYSDDPTWTTAQQQDNMSSPSDPVSRPPFDIAIHDDSSATVERPYSDLSTTAPARMRAHTVQTGEALHLDPGLKKKLDGIQHHHEDPLIDISEDDISDSETQQNKLQTPTPHSLTLPESPSIRISPSAPGKDPPSDVEFIRSHSSDRLAPPAPGATNSRTQASQVTKTQPSPIPRSTQLPRIHIPNRQASQSSKTSASPFPKFRDDPSPTGSRTPSIYLPSPSLERTEFISSQQADDEDSSRRPTRLDRIWPYSILPPPGLIISTLFPTIYHWGEKNYWEKALGIVAAPSVFLLTITLPVVECGKGDKADTPIKNHSFDSAKVATPRTGLEGRISASFASADASPGQHNHGSFSTAGMAGHGTTATVATLVEQQHRGNYGEASAGRQPSYSHDLTKSPQILPEMQPEQQTGSELWNRWLLILQLYLAPLLIVFAIFTQSPASLPYTWLIKPILICLLISTILLIPLLLTSTPTYRPPVYRHIFSMVGFVVSIAWISAIASQVVGALKALAVILNMSHAIMGLTIFAVGNSLGDLVADVTVARLGYPVMALSACFGGPMLNILLGVGLSGSYILLTGAERRVHDHPDKHFKFKTYHIEVSNTLLISGCTLLVTLVGLLIFVPMNRWVFSKRIGWALIVVWILSTIGNVVLELTGWAHKGVED